MHHKAEACNRLKSGSPLTYLVRVGGSVQLGAVRCVSVQAPSKGWCVCHFTTSAGWRAGGSLRTPSVHLLPVYEQPDSDGNITNRACCRRFFYAEARKERQLVRVPSRTTLAALLSAGLSIAMQAADKPAPTRGQGCVSAGVEPRCLVVRDLRAGKLYNLIFTGIQPTIGEGIEFVALPHRGPVVCLQGAAFDVTAWTRKDSLHCHPKGAPKKK